MTPSRRQFLATSAFAGVVASDNDGALDAPARPPFSDGRGQRRGFAGTMRDTALVPAQGRVTIAFDANDVGKWTLHSHQLYHMAAGMMTSAEYAS